MQRLLIVSHAPFLLSLAQVHLSKQKGHSEIKNKNFKKKSLFKNW